MKIKIKKICLLSLLTTLGLVMCSPLGGAEIHAEKIGSKINVTIDRRFFTSYIFSEDEKYPFFYPVNGPVSGASITSMRNGQYPHHSSLFLTCDMRAFGNYWSEGLEQGRIISVNAQIEKEGGDTVIITDECIWVRSGALSPVKDTRKYIITSPSEDKIQIDFVIVMEMLMDVHIPRVNHSLFIARMDADIAVKNGGTMINAEGKRNEKETFGLKSAWIDYYGKRGNVTEGLAIMQHPSNTWYPSPWFTRDYGFISPTPIPWPENGKETFLEKGTKLNLRYRVIVHSGTYTEAGIAEEFEKYKSVK